MKYGLARQLAYGAVAAGLSLGAPAFAGAQQGLPNSILDCMSKIHGNQRIFKSIAEQPQRKDGRRFSINPNGDYAVETGTDTKYSMAFPREAFKGQYFDADHLPKTLDAHVRGSDLAMGLGKGKPGSTTLIQVIYSSIPEPDGKGFKFSITHVRVGHELYRLNQSKKTQDYAIGLSQDGVKEIQKAIYSEIARRAPSSAVAQARVTHENPLTEILKLVFRIKTRE